MSNVILKECIELMIEAKMREADVSDGSRVSFGSNKHVRDLENRISDLVKWRDRQKKGSESRANYTRLIHRLRSELHSARKHASKSSMKESHEEKSAEERWGILSLSDDPSIIELLSKINSADSPRSLSKVKKDIEKSMDSNELPSSVTDGFVNWLIDSRREKLQSSLGPQRSRSKTDAMLRTRNSDGVAKSRKMS